MPIYEYRRPDGSTFDVIQKMSEDALTEDPETGVPIERVFHAPAIHFKGKGFHNTDYGTKRRNQESEKAASDGAAKNDAKTAEKKKEAKSSDSGSSSSSSSGSGSADAKSSKKKPKKD